MALKILKVCAAAAIVMLAACQDMSVLKPDTFNKQWAEAQQLDTTVLASALTLAQSGKISIDMLKKIEAKTNLAETSLTLAQQMHAASATTGIDQISQVMSILTALQSALADPDNASNLLTSIL